MTRKLTPNPARLWQQPIVRDLLKQTKARVGGDMGWNYLSPAMQEALIAQTVLNVAIGSARGEVPCEALHILRMDLSREAGLIDDEA